MYRLAYTKQEHHSASVRYHQVENTVVDIHSHGMMDAFFSETDNADEQGFRIFCVVGKLDQPVPEAKLRVGVYGYLWPVRWEDAFEACPL